MKQTIYVKYTRNRKPGFRLRTMMYRENGLVFVEKKALEAVDEAHIETIRKAFELNEGLYKNIRPLPGEFTKSSVTYPCLEGKSARSILEERIAELSAGKDRVRELDVTLTVVREMLDELFAYREEALCPFTNTDGFALIFQTVLPEGLPAVKYADIDIIFDNVIRMEDAFYAFDYEWTFDFPIPLAFIRYRILYRYYYSEKARFEDLIGLEDFLMHFGFSEEDIQCYAAMELSFQYHIYGQNSREVYLTRYRKKVVDIGKIRREEGDVDLALEERDRQIGVLEQKLRFAEDQYDLLIHSKSYRFGAPVRALGSGLRRMKHHVDGYSKKNPIRRSVNFAARILRYGPKEGMQRYREEFGKQEVSLRPEMFLLSEEEACSQREKVFASMPLISILVPLYNTPEVFLREMIESVQGQTYASWQLCLADGSDEAHGDVERIVREYADADERIVYSRLKENGGISDNTNACMDMATGEFIALFDHDDLLTMDALYEVVRRLNEEPEADVIYTDEDKYLYNAKTGTGVFVEPHLKPDFNIDLLRGVNYICHLFVVRRSIALEIGGFRKEYDGSQDYDFILRCTEKARKTEHIAKLLYHWRIHEASTAMNPESKEYCYEAGKRAIEAHLDRCGVSGSVSRLTYPGYYNVTYPVIGRPLVSVIIPNKDQKDTLKTCLDSILTKTTYDNYEILIVENNSETDEIREYYREIVQDERIRVVEWDSQFNYSAINNFGVKQSRGEYILLLNNDTEVIDGNWMTELLSCTVRPDVGITGAKLLYPDKTVQHGGVIIGIGGVAGHAFLGLRADDPGYFGRAILKQDLTAVTAACLMVKRSVFDAVGGLEEQLCVAFNDIDFCLKVFKAGYRIVYDPSAVLYHYESKTRGYEDTPEKQARFASETNFMLHRWAGVLEQGDPAYNKNLSLSNAFTVNLR